MKSTGMNLSVPALLLCFFAAVAEHHSSGWHRIERLGGKLLSPPQSDAKFAPPDSWVEGADQRMTLNEANHVFTIA